MDTRAGLTLSRDERAAVLDAATALRQLARMRDPPESHKAGVELEQCVRQGLGVLVHGPR